MDKSQTTIFFLSLFILANDKYEQNKNNRNEIVFPKTENSFVKLKTNSNELLTLCGLNFWRATIP